MSSDNEDASRNSNLVPNKEKVECSPKDKKGKKRIRKPEKWKKNERKCLRNLGKQYVSSRGKIMKGREMGPPCNCRLNCPIKLGNEKTRKKIFDDYWALGSLQRQRDYLCSCIDMLETTYRRIKVNAQEPRKPNCSFSFLQDGKKIKVCKPFLMSTLGIKERTVRTVIKAKFSGIGATPEDKRGKHKHHSKLDAEVEESV